MSLPPTPPAPHPSGGPPAPWPGQDRGLPAVGPGSLASIGERIGARVIDGIVWFALAAALVGVEAAIRAVAGIEATDEGDALTTALGLVLLALIAGYDPLTTRLFGATPGKRALGLQVVAESGLQPARTVVVGLRGFLQVVLWSCLIPGIFDLVAAVNDPSRRSWHDRVAATLVVRARRRHKQHPVGIVTVEPWRSLAAQATAARDRFDRTTSSASRGPLADRLADIRSRVDDCVAECQTVAARGAELAWLARGVDVTALRSRADAARADALADPGQRDLESLATALAGQAASAEHLHALVASLDRTLRRLIAQLNDAVNQAIAVVFGAPRQVDFDSLVDHLEALRAGFAEAEASAGEPLA